MPEGAGIEGGTQRPQFARRNLSTYDRSVLALQLEPLYAEEAKRNMSKGGGSGASGRQKSDNPTRTDEQIAKLAGVSRDTIRKVKTIETETLTGGCCYGRWVRLGRGGSTPPPWVRRSPWHSAVCCERKTAKQLSRVSNQRQALTSRESLINRAHG